MCKIATYMWFENPERASIHLEYKLKIDGDITDDICELNYDKTRIKWVHDFTKTSKPSPASNLKY